jgi:hypothetical protein
MLVRSPLEKRANLLSEDALKWFVYSKTELFGGLLFLDVVTGARHCESIKKNPMLLTSCLVGEKIIELVLAALNSSAGERTSFVRELWKKRANGVSEDALKWFVSRSQSFWGTDFSFSALPRRGCRDHKKTPKLLT